MLTYRLLEGAFIFARFKVSAEVTFSIRHNSQLQDIWKAIGCRKKRVSLGTYNYKV